VPKLLAAIFAIWLVQSPAQNTGNDTAGSAPRKIVLVGGTALVAGGSLIYLQDAWYSKYNSGRFHYFNDNLEWFQMDKAGHLCTSYQLSRLMMQAFSWAGFGRKQRIWVGGTLGFVYLSAVEVMDGFSRGWGFSWGDQVANALGPAIAIPQQELWGEQKFMVKFSYLPSDIARHNPALLGETPYTRILKDYNAQAYWLSFSPFSFSERRSALRWLCLSLGYGAMGMTGGHENNVVARDEHGNVLIFERRRQFFLSVDVDLTKIRTRSSFLKGLFSALNVLKIPAPTLVLDKLGAGIIPLR
jgi:hypothetical protein